LQFKDTGPAVSTLQANLVRVRCLDSKCLAPGSYTDGTFDKATRRAVMDFQMAHPGTSAADGFGVYGPATDQALQAALAGGGR